MSISQATVVIGDYPYGLMSELKQELDKVIAALGAGGELRPQQLTMAELVEQAVSDSERLFVEAGTGTGKSFAYLTPVVTSDNTAVISTATIALQSQLANHDIPHVLAALGSSKTAAILKGRNNYICKQKLVELGDETQLTLQVDETDQLEQVLEWADSTPTGDKEDLDFNAAPSVWRSVSIPANECPGASKCPMGEECFSETARNEAYAADIIVTNHFLYGLHIASEDGLLPEHETVVFDEAHQLPEIFGTTCGLDIGPQAFKNLASQFRAVSTDRDFPNAIDKVAERLADVLEPSRGEACKLDTEIVAALVAGRSICEKTVSKARGMRKSVNPDYMAKLERLNQYAEKLAVTADSVLEADADQVVWVEDRLDLPGLRVTPISVAGLVDESLDDDTAAVFTSATMPATISDQLIGDESSEVHRVGSPFDYEQLGLLYCPAHLPNPNSAEYREATHKEITDLINAAGGRTLVLFTSYSAMREAEIHLLTNCDYPILMQGDNSKSHLLKQFRERPEACLLATMSFWQGVDIPGDTLSLVIIDRIPFPRPNEPITAAKRERAGAKAFATVDIPRAQTLLAQAAGRLIRSNEDRGMVAVLDPRLATAKNYRWELINALPPFKRTKDKDSALNFLEKLE